MERREKPIEGDVIDDDRIWVKNEQKTQDHWLEVNDGEGWWSAIVKFDGCIHLNRYFNEPWGAGGLDENTDYLHICDIDDTIRRLEALRDIAKQHFGDDWE